MTRTHFPRAALLLFALLLLSACSGGAGGSAASTRGALYLTTAVETASASAQVDAGGGMHAAYVHFTADPEPSPAVYTACPAGAKCEDPASWSAVELADGAVDVQLRLTPDGKPRLLIRAHSTVYPSGRDYLYAECDSGCEESGGWSVALVASSDGTSIFDVSDQSAPQRSFALDPEGRPAFVYQDRNYFIEPDHMGAYYLSCQSGCADAARWTETAVGIIQPYDAEIFDYPALAFTPDGGPRLVANVFALDDEEGVDAEDGLYYYACDRGCEDGANWARHFLFYPGSGSYPLPSWDMEVDGEGNPHVAFFTGGGAEEEIDYQLIYLACSENCLEEDEAWVGTTLGLPLNDGQGPDIEVDAEGRPRIAFMYDYDDLGYAWCDSDCRSSAENWQTMVVDTPAAQEEANPQAIPAHCDGALWQGVTPTLALDAAGNPRIAHDVTVDARCRYEDPDDPTDISISFSRVWNGVRWNFLPQP